MIQEGKPQKRNSVKGRGKTPDELFKESIENLLVAQYALGEKEKEKEKSRKLPDEDPLTIEQMKGQLPNPLPPSGSVLSSALDAAHVKATGNGQMHTNGKDRTLLALAW
jgi:hypothetical protein